MFVLQLYCGYITDKPGIVYERPSAKKDDFIDMLKV